MRNRLLAGAAGVLFAHSVAWTQTLPGYHPVAPSQRTPAVVSNLPTRVAEPQPLPELPLSLPTQAVPVYADPPMGTAPPNKDATTPGGKTDPKSPADPRTSATNPMAGQNQNGRSRKPDLTDRHTGPYHDIWFGAHYLFAWARNGEIDASLVTGGANLGPLDLQYGFRSGGLINGGLWFNARHTLGLDGSFLFLQEKSVATGIASALDGTPTLVRPFFDPTTNSQQISFLSLPGAFRGSLGVTSDSTIWGGDINFIRNLMACDDFCFDLLAGFRYFDLREQLSIAQSLTPISPNASLAFGGSIVPNGTNLSILDHFAARNQIFAAQMGARAEWKSGPWSIGLSTKVGFGPNRQTVSAYGATTLSTTTGDPQTLPGGFYAVPGFTPTATVNAAPLGSPGPQTPIGLAQEPGLFGIPRTNFGPSTQSRFVIMPEMGVNAACQVTRWLRLSVGYSFLFVNQVVRPGEQINPSLNPRFIPSSLSYVNPTSAVGAVSILPNLPTGMTTTVLPFTTPGFPYIDPRYPAEPRALLTQSTYWLHMLQLGLEVRY